MYYVLIHLEMYYRLSSWGNIHITDLQELNILQKWFIMVIYKHTKVIRVIFDIRKAKFLILNYYFYKILSNNKMEQKINFPKIILI